MAGAGYLFKHIAQRYRLILPGGDEQRGSYLDVRRLNVVFIARVLRCFEEKSFLAADFEEFPIDVVIEYVRRTHALYLQKMLPEILQRVGMLYYDCHSRHPLLSELQVSYRRYYKTLSHNLAKEESNLLRFVERLRNAGLGPKSFAEYVVASGKYCIGKYLMEHRDIEGDLATLRQTMDLDCPPFVDPSPYRILRLQLETLQLDLHVHARIKEDVLIPKALRIEGVLGKKMRRLVHGN